MSTTNLAMTQNPVAAPSFHLLASVRPPALVQQTFAAIELSAEAVRLKIVRMTPTGVLESIHDETALCPYPLGAAGNKIASYQATWFVLTTLRRYAGLCSGHGAVLRAVATCAFARVWDLDDIVLRGRAEAGIDIQLISSREEAHLLSLAALGGTSDDARYLLIDVSADGARVILTSGEQPIALWELGFDMRQAVTTLATARETGEEEDLLNALRTRARQIVSTVRPGSPTGGVHAVVAIAGTAGAVVGFAADGGTRATGAEISRAVNRLLPSAGRGPQQGSGPGWKDLTLPGAILLEAILDRLCPGAVDSVDKRLADGVICGLARACRDADGEARGLA